MTDTSQTSAALASQRRGNFPKDMALILLGAAVLTALIVAGEFLRLPAAISQLLAVLRLLLGLVYVLYVPGYCLTVALFPRADDLDGIERAGLSLGLSIAWVPVLALGLDQLPWGLRLWPIFLGEIASILLFGAAAVWRRGRLPSEQAHAPDVVWRPRPWWRGLRMLERRVYLLCAGALLVAGLAATWIFLAPSPNELMTEFYILGQEGLAKDYPRQAAVGETLAVTMGITNREREAMTYTVEVWAVDPWSTQQLLVGTAGPFSLPAGESVEKPLNFWMPWAGDDMMVVFSLHAVERPDDEPYRSLSLWLDVTDR